MSLHISVYCLDLRSHGRRLKGSYHYRLFDRQYFSVLLTNRLRLCHYEISWLHLKRSSVQIAAMLQATWALLYWPTWPQRSIKGCFQMKGALLCTAKRSDYVVRGDKTISKGFDGRNDIFLHSHGKRKPAPELHLSALNFQSSTFFSRKTRISSIFSGYLHV